MFRIAHGPLCISDWIRHAFFRTLMLRDATRVPSKVQLQRATAGQMHPQENLVLCSATASQQPAHGVSSLQTSSVLLTCLGFVAGLVLLGLFLTPRPGPTHLAPAQSARPSASAATPGPTLVRLRNFRKGGGNWSGGVTTRDPGQRKVILLWNHAHRISPQSDWYEVLFC